MRLGLIFGIVAVVAAGALAGMLTRAPRPAQAVAAPPPPSVAIPSRVSAPAPRDYLGVVLSGESVELAPKTEGRLQSVLVKSGQHVARGAVVAELDVSSLKHALSVAQAALADAQQRLSRRTRLAAGVLSQEELANARINVVEKRGRVTELKASLADAKLRAPFDGVVAARYLDAGAMAGPTHPIVRLLGGGDARVRFAVPEGESARVSTGERARVQVKALDVPLSARVESVAPEVDAATRMVFAVARLDVPPGVAQSLTAGMVARVALDTNVGERIAP